MYIYIYIYIYRESPSIEVDNTWKTVKDYIRDTIKPNDREKCYADSYDPSESETVIKAQQQIIYYQNSQKHKHLYHLLIVIDYFADDTSFTRKSQSLQQLYIRGRHHIVSTITSTQVYNQISPIVRNKYDTIIYLSFQELC